MFNAKISLNNPQAQTTFGMRWKHQYPQGQRIKDLGKLRPYSAGRPGIAQGITQLANNAHSLSPRTFSERMGDLILSATQKH